MSPRKSKVDRTKTCRVPKCPNPISKNWACSLHYQRFRRTGHYELQREAKARQRAALEQGSKKARKIYRCICGHMSQPHHHYIKRTCKVQGCLCTSPTPVNVEFWKSRLERLAILGFEEHVWEHAKCTSCGDAIHIGKWHDPIVLRRALIHRRRECPGTRIIGINKRIQTSPDKAKKVG